MAECQSSKVEGVRAVSGLLNFYQSRRDENYKLCCHAGAERCRSVRMCYGGMGNLVRRMGTVHHGTLVKSLFVRCRLEGQCERCERFFFCF